MSDFYTLLKQSIIDRDLATAEERADAYSQARNAIIQRLWSFDPPLSEDEIDIRIGSFDDAVETIETEIIDSLAATEPVDLDEVQSEEAEPEPLPEPAPVSQRLISRSYTTRRPPEPDDEPEEAEADTGGRPAPARRAPADRRSGGRASPPPPPPPVRSPRPEQRKAADHEAPRQRVAKPTRPPARQVALPEAEPPAARKVRPVSEYKESLDARSLAVEAALNAALDDDLNQVSSALAVEPEPKPAREPMPAPGRNEPRSPIFGGRPTMPDRQELEALEEEEEEEVPPAVRARKLPPSPPPPPRAATAANKPRRLEQASPPDERSQPTGRTASRPVPAPPAGNRAKAYRLPPAAASAVQDDAMTETDAPPEPRPRPKARPRRQAAPKVAEPPKAKPKKRAEKRPKEARPEGRRVGILIAAIAALAVGLLVLVGMIFLPTGAGSATTDAVEELPAAPAQKPFTESITAARTTVPGLPPPGGDVAERFMVFDGSDRGVFSAAPTNPVRILEDSARIKTDAGSAGARALVDPSVADRVAGKTVKVTLIARSATESGAAKLRFAYQSGLAISHWQSADLSGNYAPVALDWRVPAMRTDTASNAIIIEPGIPGDGTGVDVAAIAIDVLR